ncbi:MAG: flagellar biosynthesis anti-sigma factor FlgM [Desulfobacterales bacterium]|nr:flagellar biosynthesis anti-sigma factor FlgM [Desulfobacterales bacterium]
MKITGDGNEIAKYLNETTLNRVQEVEDKSSTPAEVPTESKEDAIVSLSQTSKEVQQAKEVIQSEPDVRTEKIEAIKDEIEQGTFEIDYDKTAENMLKTFFDEII